jgi:hypothetical protein
MPRNELRTSGLLQAAVVALVVGWTFKDTAAGEATTLWPTLLGGYGLLAATVPWASGGVAREEFDLRLSLLLGVLFAAPMAACATWLADSPYRALHYGAWALVAAWGVHLGVALVLAVRRGPGAPS